MNRADCCQEGLFCLPAYCDPLFQWCCWYAQIHVILILMPKNRSPLQLSSLYRWVYPAGESASGTVSLLLRATCVRGQTLANIEVTLWTPSEVYLWKKGLRGPSGSPWVWVWLFWMNIFPLWLAQMTGCTNWFILSMLKLLECRKNTVNKNCY